MGEAICTCAYQSSVASSGGNPVDATCRAKKGTIPYCHREHLGQQSSTTPYPFAVGTKDKRVAAGEVDAPVASCYAKFENWLSSNIVGTVVILVLLFLYQLFNIVFAFWLWNPCCGCCCA